MTAKSIRERAVRPLAPRASSLVPASAWYVYILRCADDSLYTGIARDVARRVEEHNTSNRLGASYTRGRRPVTLVYCEVAESRSAALIREHEIKSLPRLAKAALLRSGRERGRSA